MRGVNPVGLAGRLMAPSAHSLPAELSLNWRGDANGLAGGFGLPTVSQGSSSALRQLGLLTVKLVAGKAQVCRLIQRASEFMEKLH